MRPSVLPPAVRSVLLAMSAALALGACAQYSPAPVDPHQSLRNPSPGPGPLGFEEAVRWSVEHNPELRALRNRASAIAAPQAEPIEVGGGSNEDGRGNIGVSVEALSLLGLGPRASERNLASARITEARARHHERARAIAVELAEAFAVEGALSGLGEPDHTVDAAAYVQAGLETGAAEAATAATRTEWSAEVSARESDRASNRSTVVRLLGMAKAPAPALTIPPPRWPASLEPTPAVLIDARADIQRLIAAFDAADAELRRAVAGQFPGLVLEPSVALDPTALFGAVRLRIPVGASAQVRAAECAREAARSDVEAGVLAALDEARQARARHRAALATLAASRARADASSQLLRATRTRLEVSSGSVIEAVFAADAVVAGARSLREASVEEARARVRAAAAAGWPGSSGR